MGVKVTVVRKPTLRSTERKVAAFEPRLKNEACVVLQLSPEAGPGPPAWSRRPGQQVTATRMIGYAHPSDLPC